MNKTSRSVATLVLALALFPLNFALARALNEDAALELLLHKLEHDHVYAKRISLDCVTFDTEETAKEYFQFVLKENHTEKCGGDPDVSPVVDRYRVYRASGKIEWYNAPNDNWQHYDPTKIK